MLGLIAGLCHAVYFTVGVIVMVWVFRDVGKANQDGGLPDGAIAPSHIVKAPAINTERNV